jgi:hypothetical protein
MPYNNNNIYAIIDFIKWLKTSAFLDW